MIKVRAKIYLYQHKGRKTPFNNGYRPAFNFDSKDDSYFSGQIELIDGDEFKLGELKEVIITFLENRLPIKDIKVGSTFSFNEPPIEIGEGKITEIID